MAKAATAASKRKLADVDVLPDKSSAGRPKRTRKDADAEPITARVAESGAKPIKTPSAFDVVMKDGTKGKLIEDK